MKQMNRIFRALAAVAAVILLWACRETIEIPGNDDLGFPVPEGEIPFTLRMDGVGNAGTRSQLDGEEFSQLSGEAIQMLCFDASGYYIGIRQAHINTVNTASGPGSFSGYVPKQTARIHFVANAGLPDQLPFSVGTSEKVVMRSQLLSTGFQDEGVKFWGYHDAGSASAMEAWLTSSTPNTVLFLRDRARITLSFASGVLSGKTVQWTVFNGRDRGYIAPYDATDPHPWNGYDQAVSMSEFEDSGRYTIYDHASQIEYASWDSYDQAQYVFDDSNMKLSTGEDGRIRIILKVTQGGSTKFLLLLLRDSDGEQIQITRNHTYNIHVSTLDQNGYPSLPEATDPSANDFANAPADVDPSATEVGDGHYTMELLEPGGKSVVRQAGSTVHVSFTFKEINQTNGSLSDPFDNVADATALEQFKIYWEDNDQSDWTIGTPVHTVAATDPNRPWEFDLTIGSIGTTYALDDYLVIRHKATGLSRSVHVYAVNQFHYRVDPELTQVFNADESPYMGPSGDDIKRPVFELSFELPESLHEDMFPLTVRMASSTLEPFGDRSSSYSSRLPGGFGIVTTSTSQSIDGISLEPGALQTDWNYDSDKWNYWYEYTINEYPSDGKVIIYLKDVRDTRQQASKQDVGLYVDIDDFGPDAEYLPAAGIKYPSYAFETQGGVYNVAYPAAKYRATITGCPAGTFTYAKTYVGASGGNWLTVTSPSFQVDEDGGEFSFIFQVVENPDDARTAYLDFSNSAYPDQVTRVTIIQEGESDSSVRVKARNTQVRGDVTEVDLTVHSTAASWTMTSTSGGKFSYTMSEESASTLSGVATGKDGVPVKLILPVNYTTDNVTYTITITSTDSGHPGSDTETVVQRGGTLLQNQTVRFLADDFRRNYPNASNNTPAQDASYVKDNSMTATFDRLYHYNLGLTNSDFNRFDVTRGSDHTATLTFEIDKQVKKIHKIEFVYHYEIVSYAPSSYQSTPSGTFSNFSRPLGSSNNYQTWTAPSGGVTGTLVFTLNNPTLAISFKQFTVTYDRITWQ